MKAVPVRALAAAPGRADLVLCAVVAGTLHAAALLWPAVGGADSPARVELRSGNISVEVSLSDPRPSAAAAEPAPPAVPEPERPALPEPAREPEPVAGQPDWPDDLAGPPAAEPLPLDVPAVPERMATPPRRPRPASAGSSGNLEAGLARHYVRHPDQGRWRVREATVRLRLRVLSSGQVGKVEVLESSGHADLDTAAVRGLQGASCIPAMRGGQPVDSSLEIAVQFRERRGKAAAE